MLNTYNDEQKLTNYLLQFCYNCERGHECTTEEMTVACMKEKCKTPQDETRDLLKWYEQI